MAVPRKRKLPDEVVMMDPGGGVRRRMERMLMAVDEEGVAKKS